MYQVLTKARKNSTSYSKVVVNLATIDQVKDYMKDENLTYVQPDPYVFTYLRLSDGTIITETVNVNGTELTCSPVKLREALLTNY